MVPTASRIVGKGNWQRHAAVHSAETGIGFEIGTRPKWADYGLGRLLLFAPSYRQEHRDSSRDEKEVNSTQAPLKITSGFEKVMPLTVIESQLMPASLFARA